MSARVNTRSRHVQSLEYALSILLQDEYAWYIRSIYLYGSCARREQKYTSDVDLFVFFDHDTPKSVIFNLKSITSPDDSDLPEVDLHCSLSNSFGFSKCYDDNLTREAKLLWERR